MVVFNSDDDLIDNITRLGKPGVALIIIAVTIGVLGLVANYR